MLNQLLSPLSRAIETAMSPFQKLALLTGGVNDDVSTVEKTSVSENDRPPPVPNISSGIDSFAGIDGAAVERLTDLPSVVEASFSQSNQNSDALLQRQLEVQEEIRDTLAGQSNSTATFGR